ncbi:MAG: carboxypeptidase regulatory-like domain-containing protein [bacterium]|nr:carboxypeptidase regulatory-like domain-containing protein [bacterium]
MPTGTVRLYKVGSHEPGLLAKVNEPVTIPQGQWTWIAEAPGFVSVAAGSVNVDEECRATGKPHPFYMWVVPACTLLLDESRSWSSIQRLDMVSLSYGAVYPLNPESSRVIQVPAGGYLAYTIVANRLFSIGLPDSCRTEEKKAVVFPAPPRDDRQALMAHLLLPEAHEDSRGDFAVYLTPRMRPSHLPVAPAATVWAQNRVSLFFPDISAMIDWQLVVEHPFFQSIREFIDSLGGSVQELSQIEILPRNDLAIEIDYRPRRPHKVARIVPHYCGPERSLAQACSPLEEKAISLREGFQAHVFEKLDWGQYQFIAEIDNFIIEGLGRGLGQYYRPYLAEGQEPQVPRERFNLLEYHIFGNILLDEEPVEGVVQIEYVGRHYPTQRSETDKDFLYHLYYFASESTAYNLSFDEREAGRDPSDLPPGLPAAYSLSACDSSGFCRNFNAHTEIRGEGRLDLDLGSSNRLALTVVDAETLDPIAGARVWTKSEEKALIFENGEVSWSQPLGAEGKTVVTAANGTAFFRNLGYGPLAIAVAHQGYEEKRDTVWIVPGLRTTAEVVVEISKEENRPGDARFQFPDGEPVVSAFLLPVRADGSRDLLCHSVTNSSGFARFRPGCLNSGRMILLHRDAEITVLEVSEISAIPEITVNRGPISPLRVRITDGGGLPMAGIPVDLQYGELSLSPNDLLAGGIAGSILFYLTDDRGELILRGVNPDAALVPTLAVAGGVTVSLSGYEAGKTVAIEITD